MKKIQVEIKGMSPLLMNSAKAMIDSALGAEMQVKTKKYDPKEEAEKVAHRNSAGKLFVPSTAVRAAMINASSFKKIGKYAAKSIVSAAVYIPEPELILDKQKYEVDARTVVIQRNRVVKFRPIIKDWKLKFEILYNEDLIDEKFIKMILTEAGQRIGLLDFRPQKTGSFGMFTISSWKPAK